MPDPMLEPIMPGPMPELISSISEPIMPEPMPEPIMPRPGKRIEP